MALRLHDATSGTLVTVTPAEAPVVHFEWKASGSAREAAFVGTAQDLLVYLGFVVNQNHGPDDSVDLYCGQDKPALKAQAWLKVAPAEGEGDGEAWRFLCLETPYRRPLRPNKEAVEAAGARLERLRALARGLAASHGGAGASPRGLAVYLQRFRERLADDLDTAGALGIVWDGLRPGALSPGSQLGLLREADAAFGLSLLPSDAGS